MCVTCRILIFHLTPKTRHSSPQEDCYLTQDSNSKPLDSEFCVTQPHHLSLLMSSKFYSNIVLFKYTCCSLCHTHKTILCHISSMAAKKCRKFCRNFMGLFRLCSSALLQLAFLEKKFSFWDNEVTRLSSYSMHDEKKTKRGELLCCCDKFMAHPCCSVWFTCAMFTSRAKGVLHV